MFSLCVLYFHSEVMRGFPGSSGGKESACNAGDPSSVPGSRRKKEMEKEMETHSSILAWKIPQTEEPGGL